MKPRSPARWWLGWFLECLVEAVAPVVAERIGAAVTWVLGRAVKRWRKWRKRKRKEAE